MAEKLSDFLIAIAVHLGAESSSLVWDPNYAYQDTDTGIIIKDVPLYPDRIVTITGYFDELDVVLPLREINFQLRIRGSQLPTNCDDIAEECRSLLHGQHRVTWNGLKIDRIRHLSAAVLGPDIQNRWERTDNYELLAQKREL